MKDRMNRREFIKHSAVIGTSSVVGGSILSNLFGNTANSLFGNEKIDIVAVQGDDYFANSIKAVELLGGMKKFVTKQSKVGLIINSPWRNVGTYTNPTVALAVLKMCLDAEVKEIISVEGASQAYWDRSDLAKQFSEQIQSLKSSGDYTKVDIPKGKKLKEAEVKKALLECDVLIDIPISKDHAGTRFTGNMKNLMGACSRTTNRFFHFGSGAKQAYDDVEHLSQCIADLSLVRKPDLCIVDSTECVTTNGPAGPGEMAKPKKIVAGTDPVAVDAYTASLLGRQPQNILMIKMAHEHGLGEMDFTKLQVEEVAQ
ncbi:MAG: DUF362 domain-containing protein [bacterium]